MYLSYIYSDLKQPKFVCVCTYMYCIYILLDDMLRFGNRPVLMLVVRI